MDYVEMIRASNEVSCYVNHMEIASNRSSALAIEIFWIKINKRGGSNNKKRRQLAWGYYLVIRLPLL
jgi:hypothetical protein